MMSLCDALAKAHRGLDDPEGASKQEVRCGELRISARVAMEFFGFPIKAANE
ncbi:MAG TPA: hypothetical protein VGP13_04220 [Candidatus Paceibacterota bacterium]|nr:hypothetical protein [Candidatus Paceibacterota bacterium]